MPSQSCQRFYVHARSTARSPQIFLRKSGTRSSPRGPPALATGTAGGGTSEINRPGAAAAPPAAPPPAAAASALTPIEYVEKHNLAPLLNTAINEVSRVQPADPVAWLSEWLAKQKK